MKKKELLIALGFKNVTGNVWSHPQAMLMTFSEDESVSDIIEQLIRRGKREQQNDIKRALNIPC